MEEICIPEILIHIFDYLKIKDLKKIQYVNKQFYEISQKYFLNKTIESKLMEFQKNNNLSEFTKLHKIRGQFLYKIFLPNGYLVVFTEMHHQTINYIVLNLIDLQGNVFVREISMKFGFPIGRHGIEIYQSKCLKFIEIRLRYYPRSGFRFDTTNFTILDTIEKCNNNLIGYRNLILSKTFNIAYNELVSLNYEFCILNQFEHVYLQPKWFTVKAIQPYTNQTFFVAIRKTNNCKTVKSFVLPYSIDQDLQMLYCLQRNDYIFVSFKNIFKKDQPKIEIFEF